MTSPNTIIADMQAQLDAAMAEIKRLSAISKDNYYKLQQWKGACLEAEHKLAAEQAKNAGLREVLRSAEDYMFGPTAWEPEDEALFLKALTEALSTPSDTSALEAYVAKAGEVMRERVVETILASAHGFPMREIRALPGVTLADIKPC